MAISVENRKILVHPLYFASLLKGFPLELVTSDGSRTTRMIGLLGRERSLTISSAAWIQSTNVTDRRTLGNSKDHAYA